MSWIACGRRQIWATALIRLSQNVSHFALTKLQFLAIWDNSRNSRTKHFFKETVSICNPKKGNMCCIKCILFYYLHYFIKWATYSSILLRQIIEGYEAILATLKCVEMKVMWFKRFLKNIAGSILLQIVWYLKLIFLKIPTFSQF